MIDRERNLFLGGHVQPFLVSDNLVTDGERISSNDTHI